MKLALPVIVVPGITATNLRDEYPISPETVWSVLSKDYSRISLHPDNILYEVLEPARVHPDNIFSIAYKELIEELRYNLREKEDEPVPVYPFAYDWRQPLQLVEDQLAMFIDEVIKRTKLMRHYIKDGFNDIEKVNLVGHSMGGLVITGYLEKYGKDSKVSRVATLATPFKGSFEAVIKVTTGTANLGTGVPSSREREAARVMPALYHLLPTCPGLKINPSLPQTNIFDSALWQKSIYQTIEEYIRLYSINENPPENQSSQLFNRLLDISRIHRQRVDNFKLESAGLNDKDWLAVVGVDTETRISLEITYSEESGPDFKFYTEDRANKWDENDNKLRIQTGDGTVPFEGAVPNFLKLENLVCITPDDFGYWEIQDKLLAKAAGFHGVLPNMNMLHRLIVRHLTGRQDLHGNTWGHGAPGVSEANWQPPLALFYKS
jgi:pimeloyl-ACP methyl ester carboxylesterase